MNRHVCTKCKEVCGFSFNRPYRPEEWIEGDPLSPIWIIGLNPRTSEPKAGDLGLHDRSLDLTRNEFASHAKSIPYFKVFKRISMGIFNGLGNGVAHTDLVKCDSLSWPPTGIDQKAVDRIVENCGEYLRMQIERYRPRLLICNGTDVCRHVKRLLPPPIDASADAPHYVGSLSGQQVVVVQTGFVGRLDNFSLRRLGIEIEQLAERMGIQTLSANA